MRTIEAGGSIVETWIGVVRDAGAIKSIYPLD